MTAPPVHCRQTVTGPHPVQCTEGGGSCAKHDSSLGRDVMRQATHRPLNRPWSYGHLFEARHTLQGSITDSMVPMLSYVSAYF